MAQRTVLIDDLTQTEGEVRTVAFSLEEVSYTIDLSPESLQKLQKALKPYIDAATPSTRPRVRRPRGAGEARSAEPTEGQLARAWLREQGITEFSSGGKLRKDLLEQYRAAQSGTVES